MKRAVLTLLFLTLAASVAGTPGEESVARFDYRSSTDCEGAACASATGFAFASPGRSDQGNPDPPPATNRIGVIVAEPSGSVGTVIYSASATWCAPTPTRCQNWGGNARLAAVNSFRFGDEPYWVRITYGEKHADALVVSFCACFGSTGYIDVSPAVFEQLAPLSVGRIAVTVEMLDWPYVAGGDPPPHPDDDRMRLEDQPLPATDAVE